MGDRTRRLIIHKTVINQQQVTVIDFPGCNDQQSQQWFVRGCSLAALLVVVIKMDETTGNQAVEIVIQV